MKSLLAVLLVALGLGAGYWKYKNPEGTIDDARSQANAFLASLKQGIPTGSDDSNATALTDVLASEVDQKISDTNTRIAALEQKLEGAVLAATAQHYENGQKDQNDQQVQASAAESDTAAESSDSDSTADQMAEATKRQLADMQKQLDSLVSGLKGDFSEQLSKLGSQVDAIRQSVDGQISTEVDPDTAESAATTLSYIDSTVATSVKDALASTQNSLNDKFQGIEARVNSIAESVDEKLESVTSSMAAKLDGDTAGDSVSDSMLNAISTQVESAMQSVDTRIQDFSTSVDSRMEGFTEKLNQLNTRTDEVTQRQTQTLSQISSMSGDGSDGSSVAPAVVATVTQLQDQLATAQNRIAELESSLAALSTSMNASTSIGDSQAQLQSQLADLESRIQNSGEDSNIAEVMQSLEQSRERINTLEQRLSSLPASTESTTALEAQSALQQQIAQLESMMRNGAKPDEEFVSTLTEVKQKVTELESRDYVTSEDLEKLSENQSIQYKVYFGSGKVDLSDPARKALDEFVAKEGERATHISIFGTADRKGSSDYNQQLALRRAYRVRSYLIQKGFDFTKIDAVDGIGEDLAAVKVEDGKEDPNQRSVIIFAFQP